MAPLAPQRVGFQFTGDQETRELYEQFRALMSHEIPTGEMALVFKAALKLAKAHVEKRKFAATDHPGQSRCSGNPRHIPAAVKRAVFERDGARCAFEAAAPFLTVEAPDGAGLLRPPRSPEPLRSHPPPPRARRAGRARVVRCRPCRA